MALDSPALLIAPQPYKDKTQLHRGILSFRKIAIRNELESNSLVISNAKYM